MDRNLQINLKFHEKVFSLYNYMAGTKYGYMNEMRVKMAYFRQVLDVTFTPRPVQENRSMVEYITKRWQTNENIQRGAHVDIMFMAVSTSFFSLTSIELTHYSMTCTATISTCQT